MANKRLIGMWAGKDWTLRSYAWRGRCVKSPMSGQNMRAIVAIDDKGKYHPGLRNSEWRGSGREYKTVYQDFTGYGDKEKAIQEARTMLTDTVESHEQTRSHLAEESRECVWNGKAVQVPQGELQGIVCRNENGGYIAGAQVYSRDQEKNWAAGPETRWLRRSYTSEPKAVAASERFVNKIAPRLNKNAPSPERQRAGALLERATTPGNGQKEPEQSRNRSGWIER
jgi:hypothetical protein